MSNIRAIVLAATMSVSAATAAMAQQATDSDTKSFAVTGNVPTLCSGGTLSGSDGTFDLGVLIDTTTGLLRTDLAAPDKVLSGAFCSARSTIAITATPLEAQNFTAAPASGFTRQIDYTATASGWTPSAASFDTGSATNANASQTRNSAFTGDITVGIADFSAAGGSALRPVADTAYRGLVTVTLSAAD